MAVTYPARELYKIKRGDSWDAVRQKSNDKCLALHLPILTRAAAASNETNKEEESIENAYQRVYCLSHEEQQLVRTKELGVRRFAHEGKACLERYRIASMRIFSVIVESLTEKLGRESFILERASIDELFIDITMYCWKNELINTEQATAKTVHVGVTNSDTNDDPQILNALERGCAVAHVIRKAVFDALGFTLSAGISTSKVVAKLGASYGKPNGQAVIFPSTIPHVMEKTEIRKVRNLGGKVGKQVQALLPPGATMGSIARLLSLPVLCEKLGKETGKMVFDACRGMDDEPVKATLGALVKSITAFKSFQKTSIKSGEVTEWIMLLATDVVSRVHLDATRNNRYPKSCTIQYTCSKETLTENTGRATRSVRIAFPRVGDVKAKLVQRVKDAIYGKEGKVFLYRIGLCAADFQTKMVNGGISSFFSKDECNVAQQTQGYTMPADQAEGIDRAVQCSQDEELPHKPVANYDTVEPPKFQTGTPEVTNSMIADEDDSDFVLAQKLQASYDREHDVLTATEKRLAAKPEKRASSKKRRIDSFFR